jgi:hypothetical protein
MAATLLDPKLLDELARVFMRAALDELMAGEKVAAVMNSERDECEGPRKAAIGGHDSGDGLEPTHLRRGHYAPPLRNFSSAKAAPDPTPTTPASAET